MLYLSLSLLLLLFTPTSSTPTPTQTAPSTVIRQFPNRTWIENVAVHRSGCLLLTLCTPAELHLLNPSLPDTTALLHSFGSGSLLGITEYQPDIFAVATGDLDIFTLDVQPGSFSVWKVDTRNHPISKPSISKIADVPQAVFLNGIAALNPHTLLLADSAAGVIYALDTVTGRSNIAINDTTLPPPLDALLPLGVNGLKVQGEYLYYTNTFQSSFHRVKISQETGHALSTPQLLAGGANFTTPDDFAIRTVNGKTEAFVMGTTNEAFKVTEPECEGEVDQGEWKWERVLGGMNSSVIGGPTSASFGRKGEENMLYITTDGGADGPINGTFVEGGKVVAVKV